MENNNLGIYLSSLSKHDQLKDIYEAFKYNIGSKIKDASIFYDNVAHNPFNINCGLFNSTDLWSFKGTLITTCLSTTLSAIKIVNNIKIYYYYGLEKKISPLSLIYLLKNSDIDIVAKTDIDALDLYRKTRINPKFISSDLKDLIMKVIV